MNTDDVWFHTHAHSHYSVLDGMPPVQALVETAARNKQPALGLTDHGNMSGAVELYKESKAAGIKPFPGEEFYFVPDLGDKTAQRTHLTMIALNFDGYRDLVKLSSISHQRDHYHYRPRITFDDFDQLEHVEGIAVMTGCYFGYLIQRMLKEDEFDSQVARQVGRKAVEILASFFPNLFIEVQHHNTQGNDVDDDTQMKVLADIGFITSVPLIVSQDAHYCTITEKHAHDTMKRMAYRGSDDATFPGDSYHLARTRWVKSHYKGFIGEQVWAASLNSCARLLDLHDLEMEALDKYTYHIPKPRAINPQSWLDDTAEKGLRALGLTDKKYTDQLLNELAVIQDLGMAGYFHLIHKGVEFCKQNGIMVAARGSANSSLVCYALGITQIDPLKWNLMFERFLSRDRKKPPDIDLDIESDRRAEVVDFYRNQYDVTQIGTYNTLGESAIGKGSVLVQYLSWARKKYSKDEFNKHFGHVMFIDDLPEDTAEMLHKIGAYRIKKSAGAHAAGFLIGTKDFPITEYVPTMLIPSSKLTVTQFTMEAVEELGYIKVDLLGQRTLTTLRRVLELLGKDGVEWIPINDKDTLRQLRQGRTDTGVFQLEGWAAARGCRDLAVRNVKDVIAIMALYRPAVMSSGYLDLYLSNRRGQTKPVYPHPIFKKHLKETYGVAVYQEQVMAILRELGVPFEELNEFLSALKMSNHKTATAIRIFKTQKRKFLKLCIDGNGMDKEQAKECWDTISGFAEYGFNRAHATAYGLLGYRMAYLKTHYPLEFFAALLETTAGTPKERKYVAEARRLGVRLRPADVNRSHAVWSLDHTGIRRGLTSIKGVGLKAALEIEANAPYDSVEDLIERCNRRVVTGGLDWKKTRTLKGVMEALRNGGALRSLGVDSY